MASLFFLHTYGNHGLCGNSPRAAPRLLPLLPQPRSGTKFRGAFLTSGRRRIKLYTYDIYIYIYVKVRLRGVTSKTRGCPPTAVTLAGIGAIARGPSSCCSLRTRLHWPCILSELVCPGQFCTCSAALTHPHHLCFCVPKHVTQGGLDTFLLEFWACSLLWRTT